MLVLSSGDSLSHQRRVCLVDKDDKRLKMRKESLKEVEANKLRKNNNTNSTKAKEKASTKGGGREVLSKFKKIWARRRPLTRPPRLPSFVVARATNMGVSRFPSPHWHGGWSKSTPFHASPTHLEAPPPPPRQRHHEVYILNSFFRRH